MEHSHVAPGPATTIWWKRENLWQGLALVVLAAVAWAYTLSQSGAMQGMAPSTAMGSQGGMEMPAEMGDAGMRDMGGLDARGELVRADEVALFLVGWAAMMVAMMLPAALPLILLYRTVARQRLRPGGVAPGMAALLAGYIGVWTAAGLPVYAYTLLARVTGPIMAVVPGLLLIAGGVYQFTRLKQGCHTRCSSPLFFLMNQWRPGARGAARLGMLHGVDCLGCCLGLMIALVALGMMHVTWMLTAAVIIFVEKTLPGGHRVARPLGILLIVGGMVVIAVSLFGSGMAMS